jgi:hypothetical protein
MTEFTQTVERWKSLPASAEEQTCDCDDNETDAERAERQKIAAMLNVPLEQVHRLSAAPQSEQVSKEQRNG